MSKNSFGTEMPTVSYPLRMCLPRLPAILLAPVILIPWLGLCVVPHRDPLNIWTDRLVLGWPMPFAEGFGVTSETSFSWSYRFDYLALFADVGLALCASYLITMAVERLIFPMVRDFQGQEWESQASGRSTSSSFKKELRCR